VVLVIPYSDIGGFRFSIQVPLHRLFPS